MALKRKLSDFDISQDVPFISSLPAGETSHSLEFAEYQTTNPSLLPPRTRRKYCDSRRSEEDGTQTALPLFSEQQTPHIKRQSHIAPSERGAVLSTGFRRNDTQPSFPSVWPIPNPRSSYPSSIASDSNASTPAGTPIPSLETYTNRSSYFPSNGSDAMDVDAMDTDNSGGYNGSYVFDTLRGQCRDGNEMSGLQWVEAVA